MMRKVFVWVALAAIIAIFFSAPSFAGNTTSAEFVIGLNQYFVNNQTPGTPMDAAPYIDASSDAPWFRSRYLGDALGAQTNWDAAARRHRDQWQHDRKHGDR